MDDPECILHAQTLFLRSALQLYSLRSVFILEKKVVCMCKDFAWSFSISLMLNNEGKHCTKLKAQGISMDFISQLKGARNLNFEEKCQ